MPHEVKDQTDFVAKTKNKMACVDFYAQWCGPCKKIAPAINKLSEEYKDVVFLKVDVDANPDITEAYHVAAMPTFIFIKSNGHEDGRLRVVGANVDSVRESLKLLTKK